MSMFTSMLYLLDEAKADGINTGKDHCQFVIDRDAFWREIEREWLKVSEPLSAFGKYIFLQSGLGRVELRCLDELGHRYDDDSRSRRFVLTEDWQVEANGDETLKQMARRMYKSLPEVMKDDRWPYLINAAETMQQMSDLYVRIEALRRASLRLSRA